MSTAPLAPPTNLAATLHGTETLLTWNVTWNVRKFLHQTIVYVLFIDS